MRINQCDLCGRTVEGTIVMVGKLLSGVELCRYCAKPVIEFLEENNLLDKARLQDLATVGNE